MEQFTHFHPIVGISLKSDQARLLFAKFTNRPYTADVVRRFLTLTPAPQYMRQNLLRVQWPTEAEHTASYLILSRPGHVFEPARLPC